MTCPGLVSLDNVRLKSWFPADRIFPEEDEVFSATLRAVRQARQLAATNQSKEVPEGIDTLDLTEKEPAYYLV